MYNDGFEDITNIDISEVVIKKMSSKHAHMKFVSMDITNLEFGEEKFDLVIEKSTLDALLVDNKSHWDLDSPKLYIKTRLSHGVRIWSGRHRPRSDENDFQILVKNLTEMEAHIMKPGGSLGTLNFLRTYWMKRSLTRKR